MLKTSTFVAAVVFFTQLSYADSVLCENNQSNQLSFSQGLHPRNTDEFSVVTWNAHKLDDAKFIPDLVQLSEETDFLAMQEAMHSDTYQVTFLNNFSFAFSFHKSFCDSKKQATGVMNMSRFNLENNRTLVSPENEPVTGTPKVSGYSTLNVDGTIVHIINTHALNFNMGSKFERHINSVADFIKTLQGPVVWTGDFNTWSAGRMKHLTEKTKALGLTHQIPANDNRGQKLDHIFSRGLTLIKVEVLSQYKSSDHLPLKAVFKKR